MNMQIFQNLSNKLLISTPILNHDKYFAKAIVYILTHDQVAGSLGVIVNSEEQNAILDYTLSDQEKADWQEASNLHSKDLNKSSTQRSQKHNIKVRVGGPYSNSLLIFHTNDHLPSSSLLRSEDVQKGDVQHLNLAMPSLSKAGAIYHFAKNNIWPSSYFIVSGFSTWMLGQLENEIKNDYWIIQDFCSETVFKTGSREQRWEEAIAKSFDHKDKILLTTNFSA